jgi:Zn-dependent peptidase ImmA (M78 family)
MNVKIGARSYAVSFVSLEDEENKICGYTDYHKGEIILNDSLVDDAKMEVLLHEMLHCLLDNAGINEIAAQLKNSKGDEEQNLAELICNVLAPRLHAFLLDNDVQQLLNFCKSGT